MSEAETLFATLRQSTGDDAVAMLERMVRDAPDHALSKINALDVAAKEGIGEEHVIGALLNAVGLGVFEMSWNVMCPSCAGVLSANKSLKTIDRAQYHCAFCAAGYETTLDNLAEVTLEAIDVPPGERAILSLRLPQGTLIVFDPVTHTAQFLDVAGEETSERQNLSMIFKNVQVPVEPAAFRPGPLRLALDNRSDRRVLPAVWIANQTLDGLLKRRKPILNAKRLLTNQTFRDIYRTDTLAIGQRLKILSLTFLFSDLKGSTALYDRVGDLVAFDLVNEHFRLLQ